VELFLSQIELQQRKKIIKNQDNITASLSGDAKKQGSSSERNKLLPVKCQFCIFKM
jgi:hypothetical protein